MTVASHKLYTCGKLPGTLALFAVLGQVHICTMKPILPSFVMAVRSGVAEAAGAAGMAWATPLFP